MTESIAVIFGGPSDEHDISILTGLQSSRILSSKYDVLNIYWSKENKWYLVKNDLESIDFVDNIIAVASHISKIPTKDILNCIFIVGFTHH